MNKLVAAVQGMNDSFAKVQVRREAWRKLAPEIQKHLAAITQEVSDGLKDGKKSAVRLVASSFPQPDRILELHIGFGRGPIGVMDRSGESGEGHVIESGAELIFQLKFNGDVNVFWTKARIELPSEPPDPFRSVDVGIYKAEKLNDLALLRELVEDFVIRSADEHWSVTETESREFAP